MKRFLPLVFLFTILSLNAQENFNLDLVSQTSVGEDGNDIWGYTDENGLEYAVIGTRTATRIFSLEDPAAPIERAVISGFPSIWRDIKSFEDHLYVTTDQGQDGLLIIDMSMAPDTINFNYWRPELAVGTDTSFLNRCHNLYIDTEDGYCYLAGCNNGNRGVLIFDLNENKDIPEYVGAEDFRYSHDVYVKDNLLYSSEITDGLLSIYDVTDKSNPTLINSTSTTRNFTHNAWLSDDGNYIFTTDERANAFVDAYDISDLNDIVYLDSYQPLETQNTGVIPHNTHVDNGFLVTSWYTDGVVIIDANKPDNLVKVGSYDTELEFTSGFEGCWGAYPYLPSGLILASDINHGLFVLNPVQGDTGTQGYVRASYLEGKVTDAENGQAIQGVEINILSDDANAASTNLSGDYKTGQATPGIFDVQFVHPNYDPVTVSATLLSGEVTILNVQLGNVKINGSVTDTDGNPIADAQIAIKNVESQTYTTASSDVDGNWTLSARASTDYEILVGKWGYKGGQLFYNSDEDQSLDIILEDGYEDDFFADLGWTTEATASSGFWEIAIPNETFLNNDVAQTSMDIEDDLGEMYYVTGASGTQVGENDIDDGFVRLTSPLMDLSEMNRLDLSFHLWFVNGGGNSAPNDNITVELTNGETSISLIDYETSASEWTPLLEYNITWSDIPFTDKMAIIVTAYDTDPGHVVEAGIDAFSADAYFVSSVNELNIDASVYPNPASEIITLDLGTLSEDLNYKIIDINGRIVSKGNINSTLQTININTLNAGKYIIQLQNANKRITTLNFVKM